MSVKIRLDRRGRFEVDILIGLPDGAVLRKRVLAPVSSISAARRWAKEQERQLLAQGPPPPRKQVPTLTEFASRFLSGYVEANRHKPSGLASKSTILRVHLLPALGSKPLDGISNEDVQQLKSRLKDKSPKTVNNVLTVLGKLLKVAVEWNVIDRMPCRVQFVRAPKKMVSFLDFDEYARLGEAARGMGQEAYLIVLLGGDAGLRCGEMMALEWSDVDLEKRQIVIERSEWKGEVTAPKGGRPRVVPLTARLAEALKSSRHLRSTRVLSQKDGSPFTQKEVQIRVWNAAKRAGLKKNVGPHLLRHTFCSHLAMRGAPARAVQEVCWTC